MSDLDSSISSVGAPPGVMPSTLDVAISKSLSGTMPDEAQGKTGDPLAATPTGPFGGLLAHEASGFGASAIAGVRGAYDLATGVPLAEADRRAQQFIAEHTYEPSDTPSRTLIKGFESNANPLNWIGKGFDVLGETINRATDPRTWTRRVDTPSGNPLLADKAGTAGLGPPSTALPTTGTGSTVLGPIVSGIGQIALGTVPFMRGVGAPEIPKGRTTPGWGREAPPSPEPPSPARSAPIEVQEIPGRPGVSIDTEPVEGGLPSSATQQRASILSRVGLTSARNSALEGNAKNAATDWQLSKFDEPAGVAAKAQFDAERTALQSHAQSLVERTGGTLGTDEDSLNIRGQTIAKPFDALSDWFDEQRQKLYAAADQRSGGHPVVQPLSLQGLLDDPSFKNQLTARDQLHIRNGVAAELNRFQETNPQGLSVQNAEQFRQFLNTLWTPENSPVIGKLKGALDDDVMKGAGEDLYGPARGLTQMEKQTLQNPNGISRLLERDPQTPINRTTPYTKIPDTLARLAPDQFNQVIKTLQTMPEAIQPDAQAALSEIKAHLANKVLDAGNSPMGQWNTRGVEKVARANSAKLQSAFADQPDVLQGIQDLRSAGNILSVNQGYPGAAAQASNALRRGMMSQAISRVGGVVGAGGGSVLGPVGAAGGAAVGEAVGARMGKAVAEKAAVKRWESGLTQLSDVAK